MTGYCGGSGTRYEIGKQLGKGGEGTVHEIVGMPTLVAKIYSPAKLAGQGRKILEDKLGCMVSMGLDPYLGSSAAHLAVAWPMDTLSDQVGQFCGYVMPRVGTRENLLCAYAPAERTRLFKGYTWRHALTVAFNLALAVAKLHECGVVIGDFNTNNAMLDATGRVTFVDTDSFSVTDKSSGRVYKCMVGVGESLAPELQGRDLSAPTSVFTEASDRFSLAVHLFSLLMDGYHPFGCSGLASACQSSSVSPIATSIATGTCPYVSGAKGDRQPGAPNPEMLPPHIRSLFDRCFTYTAATAVKKETIGRRPTAAEWVGALGEALRSQLVTCERDPSHVYLPSTWRQPPHNGCPWCERDVRNGVRIPSSQPPTAASRKPSSQPHVSSSSPTGGKVNVSPPVKACPAAQSPEPRPVWPLWTACISVGALLAPMFAGPCASLFGADDFVGFMGFLLAVFGGLAGCGVAYLVRDRYAAETGPSKWIWSCLAVPFAAPVALYVAFLGLFVLVGMALIYGLIASVTDG